MVSSILFGVILLFFQIFKASALSIWGITPNVLLAYSAYLGAYRREKYSLPIIFLTGLGYDLVTPETLGINTLLLLLICWVTGILKKSILEPKLITVGVLSLVYNVFYYLIFGLFYSLQTENMNYIFAVFGVNVVINSLISILLFYFLLLLSNLKIVIR
ncbi:MAG: rod shape-determining protein MreD [Candidatus Cloacimonetes bacterium]|nr:rod shape-determining protein MreD [Candidatus Cloacimonadota bacterium]